MYFVDRDPKNSVKFFLRKYAVNLMRKIHMENIWFNRMNPVTAFIFLINVIFIFISILEEVVVKLGY